MIRRARRMWDRAGPWLTPALVAVEVVLVWSGPLSLRDAVVIGLACEILLWLTIAGRAIAGLRRVRAGRAAGMDGWQAAEDGLAQVIPRRAAKIVLFEPRLLVCLARWLTGRHDARAAGAFGNDRWPRILIGGAIGLTVVEGAVVDLVLALALPGSVWVWVALGVHLYGIVWLLGFYASYVTRPHLLDDQKLRVRDAVLTELVVPYAAIPRARAVTTPNFGRSGLKVDEARKAATLAFGDATVIIDLDPAQPVEIAGRTDSVSLTSLTITADAPRDFVRALRSRIDMVVPATASASARAGGTPPELAPQQDEPRARHR